MMSRDWIGMKFHCGICLELRRVDGMENAGVDAARLVMVASQRRQVQNVWLVDNPDSELDYPIELAMKAKFSHPESRYLVQPKLLDISLRCTGIHDPSPIRAMPLCSQRIDVGSLLGQKFVVVPEDGTILKFDVLIAATSIGLRRLLNIQNDLKLFVRIHFRFQSRPGFWRSRLSRGAVTAGVEAAQHMELFEDSEQHSSDTDSISIVENVQPSNSRTAGHPRCVNVRELSFSSFRSDDTSIRPAQRNQQQSSSNLVGDPVVLSQLDIHRSSLKILQYQQRTMQNEMKDFREQLQSIKRDLDAESGFSSITPPGRKGPDTRE